MQECRVQAADAESVEAEELETSVLGLAAAAEEPPINYLAGAVWGLLAISIWAGWFVSTRFNVTSDLSVHDLVALRFGVAAIVLIPVAIRLRGGIELVGWRNGLALFAGSGIIYSLCSTGGIAFAPAAEGAALTPGVMPLSTALLSVLLLKERLSTRQFSGFAFILGGVILIGGLGLFHGGHREWIGHVLFLTGAFLFAGYTIALRRTGLSGLEATALVSLWSCIVYLPIYFFAFHPHLFEAPLTSLLFPAFYQGIMANVVSLVAYGRAVSILGASRAASFAALIPAVTAFLSLIILGEYPSIPDWAGIVFVSAGVYLASGAPLPWPASHSRI